MAKRRRLGAYGAAVISAALLGGCALVAGLFEPKPPNCGNGVKDADETGVDCGGKCPKCDGAKCENNDDCRSLNCADGECRGLTCYENSDDPCDQCHRCGHNDPCASNLDCNSGLCVNGNCDNCTGNGQCPGEGRCEGGVCLNVTCNNGVQNLPEEKGVDCGGACEEHLGKPCLDGGTGGSGTGGTGTGGAPTCHDQVQNGGETHVDCGGPCLACQGDPCEKDYDCVSTICDVASNQCVGCYDGDQNGDETGLDCGGHDCDPCADGEGCLMDDDCTNGFCHPPSSTCVMPTCMDGFQNQNEALIDCGGPCAGCNDAACIKNTDCVSGNCVNQVCRTAGCKDNMYTPGCGMPNLAACAVDTDCWSGKCNENQKCAPPMCDDSVKNGGETDVDCGTACPFQGCVQGQTCAVNLDCQLGLHCDSASKTCQP